MTFVALLVPGLPGVPEEHARRYRRLPLPGRQLRRLQPRDGCQSIQGRRRPRLYYTPGPAHQTLARPQARVAGIHVIYSDSRLPAGGVVAGAARRLR